MPTVDTASHVIDSLFHANDTGHVILKSKLQPVKNTLLLPKDTLWLSNDSVFAVDSVQIGSVIHNSDTTNLQSYTGFEGIPHPSFPSSENWIFGTIFFLFFLLVFSFLRSSNWLYGSFRSFFHVKKRSSIFVKTTVNDFHSQLILVLFSVAVLTLYVQSTRLFPMYGYKFIDYLYLLGLTLIFFVVKLLLAELVGYIFVNKTSLRLARESYLNLLVYFGILQFVVLVFQLYSPEQYRLFLSYIGLLIIFLAFVVLLIKLFQIFYDRFVVSFYILLYLCTLEIIPFILLFWLFRMIVIDV